MEIRILKPEENLQYGLLSSVCFAMSPDDDYESKLKEPEKHSEGYENKLGGFDEKGNIIAGLHIIPYSMQFDGHSVKMGGIQSVVTAPEARAGGVMGKVFTECLRIMKERGQIFSVLYPFSCAYYRKFGYEIAYRHPNVEIGIEPFSQNFPFPQDSVRFWKKGDSTADMQTIYKEFQKSRNYAIDRDNASWEKIIKDEKDPYINKRYSYIHYDKQQKPDSYLRMRVETLGSFHINELAWATKEGLYDMLGFIGGLRPQYNSMHWCVPMELDLQSLIPEARDVTFTNPQPVMTRIVDLPAVLKLLRPPAFGSGSVVIDVTDKSLPENSGKYAIFWENGKLSVERNAKQEPDMLTSIEAMAQMVTGYASPDTAEYRRDTTIHSKQEALALLFPKKKLYMWERF